MSQPYVVAIRERPALDNLIAAWLASRYLSKSGPCEVVSIPRDQLVRIRDFAWVADPVCGMPSFDWDFEPKKKLRFVERFNDSATGHVWSRLSSEGAAVAHLVDLVDAIHAEKHPRQESGYGLRAPAVLAKLKKTWHHAKQSCRDERALFDAICAALDDHDGRIRKKVIPVDLKRFVPLLPQDKGTYALVVQTAAPGPILVGRTGWRGILMVRPGYYVYTGSACNSGGLRSRLKRHLAQACHKSIKWQIDSLRTRASVVEVWITNSPLQTMPITRECEFATCIRKMPGAVEPLRHFGATDCGCPAHLAHFESRPSFRSFQMRVHRSTVPCQVQRLVLDDLKGNTARSNQA